MTAILTRRLADVCDILERDARRSVDEVAGDLEGYAHADSYAHRPCALCRKALARDEADATGLAHRVCADEELRDIFSDAEAPEVEWPPADGPDMPF